MIIKRGRQEKELGFCSRDSWHNEGGGHGYYASDLTSFFGNPYVSANRAQSLWV